MPIYQDINFVNKVVIYYQVIFVCMTLIGVKSKYGSCSRNCTGLININNKQKKKKKSY